MDNNMKATIEPKSEQLNADDLLAGPRTITIKEVKIAAGSEQPVAIRFDGDEGRAYLPCKSMRRVMVAMWGPDASAYAGRSMTLYRDPDVTWGGMAVGGIRISHMSHIEKPTVMMLTATKKARKPFTVAPLKISAPVEPVNTAPADKPRRTFASVLAEVRQKLADARTEEDVEAVMTSQDAQALSKREDAAVALGEAFKAAMARLAPVDEEFPA
ncbi:hypothetical protein UFOVP853_7 [uncultured Caudovirales phage]|uniref:Uncharacterized protein n=1 Tax=uncultured Caudovirales phage TaxID=2100421 RepID=A0A6J5P976_9CAUD|nr:hypothetical protein UFOVP853_7 [uncultured Caudovirales phage]